MRRLVFGQQHGGQRRDLISGRTGSTAARRAGAEASSLQHLHRHDGRAVVALGQALELGGHREVGERSSAIHTVGGAKKLVMPGTSRSGASTLSGTGLAVITLLLADIDGRAEEHVGELGAVVEQQRVQGAVVFGDTGVDTQLTYCQSTASWVSMAPTGVDSVPLV
ncbi:MAG: hypothetical protein U5L46_09710 [Agrobacterium sp.]|nr:hypothetical protein [Agrobacterium sp.]